MTSYPRTFAAWLIFPDMSPLAAPACVQILVHYVIIKAKTGSALIIIYAFGFRFNNNIHVVHGEPIMYFYSLEGDTSRSML